MLYLRWLKKQQSCILSRLERGYDLILPICIFFENFPALIFWWFYNHSLSLMLQSWYHKNSQPLVNTWLYFLWDNRLLYRQYDLLKTPLITALEACSWNTAGWFFFYQHLISMIRRNFWQSLKKFCTWGSEPPCIFENLESTCSLEFPEDLEMVLSNSESMEISQRRVR